MKARTFQVLLETLGIQSSYSRQLVSNDNPYSESVFQALKYRPEFPYKGFKSIEDARESGPQDLSIGTPLSISIAESIL